MRARWSVWMPVALAGLVERATAANTFEMAWSSEVYGPDGPWQAVEVRIGSDNTLVNLYPGGTWGSNILSPSVCNNASLGDVCYAELAGLYDPSTSATSNFGNITITSSVDFSGGVLNMGGSEPETGIDNWNLSSGAMFPIGINMNLHSSSWATLPDGSTYPLTVGSLGLGAPGTVNQTFTEAPGTPAFNATLLPGYLSTEAPSNKILSSNSYGLHIGSVYPKVPPSLYFGGFDQNRVLGTVSTQEGNPGAPGAIDLLDISLSVNSGVSPWSFKSLDGLLASGNSSIQSQLPVAIDALAPYISLPKSTCDAIAANLPVTYQAKYGLYFWNTSDPQYERIVTSPSSLGFTFRASESSQNFTIYVPFNQLNLTLTAPLTTTSTSYFPCKAEENTYYQLGRAFLQSAFVGVNWNAYNGSAAWWLAQAPGPNIPSQSTILAIGNTDTSISSSTVDWASTWQDTWTVLTQTSGTPSSSATASSSSATNSASNNSATSGLSTGAKAGIGVAAGIVGLLAIIAGVLFFVRRRPATAVPIAEAPPATESQPPEMQGYAPPPGHATYYDPPKAPGHSDGPSEIYSPVQRYELQSS
jgi:hypothetical protein